ncbi:MAG: 16S rRNA (cytosine(1402)-N(4))-methyltransferase RsmH [Patescibacteria group bacterium]|jgi:16S rRNA (cytosine1402-N4)-methyltransferase
MQQRHAPVLLEEVIRYLHPLPNQNFVDATYGGGGHATALLQATKPAGQIFTFDVDPGVAVHAKSLGNRVHHFTENFSHINKVLSDAAPTITIHGILFDLGYSSLQLADETLGLSFQTKQPLDMRLSRTGTMTAAVIVNTWQEAEIADALYQFGEERASRRIAAAIVRARKIKTITTTDELAAIVAKAAGKRSRRIHPATLTFQALRIAVNNELENLREGIVGAKEMLTLGGRIAVISFHSLEDRIVKQMFRDSEKYCHCAPESLQCRCDKTKVWKIITKKPVTPTSSELLQNPRSRSAKLRVLEKCI